MSCDTSWVYSFQGSNSSLELNLSWSFFLKLINRIYPFLQLGYPLPKLVWYTSDSEQGGIVTIADSSYDILGGATRNTLSIARLERSHFGQTFSCQAMNNNVTDPVTTNVTIDMRRKFFFLNDYKF